MPGGGPSLVPHSLQNLASSPFSVPHPEHNATGRVYAGQNAEVTVLAVALDRLRRLEARDRELLQDAGAVETLMERTASVRRDAADTLRALASLPVEREALAAAVREAAERTAAADRALAEARATIESAERARRDRDAKIAEAQADLRVAEERRLDAGRHVERLAASRVELDERARTLVAQRERLEAAVATLAAEVSSTHRVAAPALHRVPDSLEHLDDWGVEARAALFVARGSIATERDRLVAEANAVGSAALGEDVGALGVSQVIRRLESAG